eukprot:gnl/TRDRNA2_/TRDRNA2_138308_c0_seq1.p2 gnl/TRDRNA2_/TRDRNA2_138308_c0~~gnl/TRDRNA2_/TRDRNA2_138308_c0_seq1.p2  ORF type:complete len:124 (-),score=13.64 gnl/TRDRNA2_/TRDRNA2_138308_c0_seq1:281-652(-)
MLASGNMVTDIAANLFRVHELFVLAETTTLLTCVRICTIIADQAVIITVGLRHSGYVGDSRHVAREAETAILDMLCSIARLRCSRFLGATPGVAIIVRGVQPARMCIKITNVCAFGLGAGHVG